MFKSKPTPWSRVLLDKVIDSQVVEKFPHFMEPKISLYCVRSLNAEDEGATSLRDIGKRRATVTSQKTWIINTTAVESSNLTCTLLCLQRPTTYPYSEPDEFASYTSLTFKVHFHIQSMPRSSKRSLSFRSLPHMFHFHSPSHPPQFHHSNN